VAYPFPSSLLLTIFREQCKPHAGDHEYYDEKEPHENGVLPYLVGHIFCLHLYNHWKRCVTGEVRREGERGRNRREEGDRWTMYM